MVEHPCRHGHLVAAINEDDRGEEEDEGGIVETIESTPSGLFSPLE